MAVGVRAADGLGADDFGIDLAEELGEGADRVVVALGGDVGVGAAEHADQNHPSDGQEKHYLNQGEAGMGARLSLGAMGLSAGLSLRVGVSLAARLGLTVEVLHRLTLVVLSWLKLIFG